MSATVRIGQVVFGNHLPFVLIAGPCQMESRQHAFDMAGALQEICAELGIGLIYKSSFDKANRTSGKAARGIGLEKALAVFAELKARLTLPTITDVHEPWHCAELAGTLDMLQIPAFLCRQTDLLLAAARTGLAVNVKKGQFLAPWDMKNVIDKLREAGNDRALACDRGTSFGYNTLVSDFRGLAIMAEQCQCPIVFDATHSVQQPGGQGGASGGQREFVPLLARAAVAVGVAGLFIETHQNPDAAPSDGPNMVPLAQMRPLLERLRAYDRLTKG